MTASAHMLEEWRPVVGWEGIYEVSDRGGVRSLPRISEYLGYQRIGVVLKQELAHGYPRVNLCRNGRIVKFYVHRLIACAFLGYRDGSWDVNHIDSNRANSVLSNLEWCTRKENVAHAIRAGRKVYTSKFTKSNAMDVLQCRRAGIKQKDIAKLLGLPIHFVHPICRGTKWGNLRG